MREVQGLYLNGKWCSVENLDTTTIYEARDGTCFDSAEECEEYEADNDAFARGTCYYFPIFNLDPQKCIRITNLKDFKKSFFESTENTSDAWYVSSKELEYLVKTFMNEQCSTNKGFTKGLNVWCRLGYWVNINQQLEKLERGQI